MGDLPFSDTAQEEEIGTTRAFEEIFLKGSRKKFKAEGGQTTLR